MKRCKNLEKKPKKNHLTCQLFKMPFKNIFIMLPKIIQLVRFYKDLRRIIVNLLCSHNTKATTIILPGILFGLDIEKSTSTSLFSIMLEASITFWPVVDKSISDCSTTVSPSSNWKPRSDL